MRTKPPKGEELEWLRSAVLPLRSFDMNYDYEDLDPLKEIIGNAKIVALGEVSHGSSEIFKMKGRIIKYLVEEAGFNVFAIEASMPDAYKLNEYIINGTGDPKKLIKEMGFWTWDTQEMLDIVVWMKKYNDGHFRKINFTGFDMQFYPGALKEIKNKLNRYGISYNLSTLEMNLKNLNDRMDEALKRNQYKRKLKESKSIQKELSYLKHSIAKMIPDKKDQSWFIQNIRILEQFSELLSSYRKRDRYMAENLLWITTHSDSGSKFIVWAHNGHIRKTDGMFGAFVSKELKKDYLAVGFAFHKGTSTAYGPRGGIRTCQAQASSPGSYEYYFHMAGLPLFMIDFKRVSSKLPQAKWLHSHLLFRVVGAMKEKEEFEHVNILKEFDALIFIDKSTNSALLHKW